jgi:putative tryptophan/tyrosine transport system substrate-binding protein
MNIPRRDFITLLGGAAVVASPLWPFAARAQQPVRPVIGFLGAPSAAPYARYVAALHQGLKEAGYVEGSNASMEYRWADGQYDHLPALAADLVNRHVAVIVAIGGAPAAVPAKAATSTIPIVFNMTADPVELGLVASLNRPGGNVTGVAMLGVTLETKRFELLHELVPTAALIGVLVNPRNAQAEMQLQDVQKVARAIGQQILILNASTAGELEAAFAKLAQERAAALLVGADTFFTSQPNLFAALTARHAMPAIYPWRSHVDAGGLMSYGTSLLDAYRQTGIYAGRILKGEKPADLPVMQAVKFEFVVNLKTAKALGLDLPPTLLATADEVIE